MRLVTWNVNSIRMRLPRLIALLERHRPDVVCLQETKCSDDAFPQMDIQGAGYEAAMFGSGGRNGVAILSRLPLADVRRSFPSDPASEAARTISAIVGGTRVVCVYAINGKGVGMPEWELKLSWLDALSAWMTSLREAGEDVVVAGDFNVAPDERDVHDPDAWRGQNLFSEPERARITAMLAGGYEDVLRSIHVEATSGPFTWWDYRDGAFHRGLGLRIDLVLATAAIAKRVTHATVDRDERKPTSGEGKPSDHAPLIVDW